MLEHVDDMQLEIISIISPSRRVNTTINKSQRYLTNQISMFRNISAFIVKPVLKV